MNAAGILFVAPNNIALFLKRDADSDHPGEWDLPGGMSQDNSEALEDTARREANEELQDHAPVGELEKLCTTNVDGVDYTTFVQRVPEQFVPVLNSEHNTYKWSPISEPPDNLHPGVVEVLMHVDDLEDIIVGDENTEHDPDNGQFVSKGGVSSDPAIVNVPLSKRGDIDAQLDRYKAEQAELRKTERKANAEQTRQHKALAKSLMSEYESAIIEKHGPKFGEKPLKETLDRWAKWEPAKLIDFVAKFKNETKQAQDSEGMAFDRASVRTYDADGRMHVALTNISKSNVCGYYGREIPDSEKLGLKDDKIYKLLRDPQELNKAAGTFNNLPLLSKHVPVTAKAPQKELIVGSTGTDAVFQAPYLRNSLVVWDAVAIAGVESDEQKELSCAYRYRADMKPGVYEGEKYDGVMRDIRGNHVALVVDGRAGDDVVVGDSSLVEIPMSNRNKVLSPRAILAKGAIAAFLMPRLAQDAKVDLNKIVSGVTAANWLAKKSAIVGVVNLAVKDKLAADASIDGLVKLLDGLDNDDAMDPLVPDADPTAVVPGAPDPDAPPMPGADPAPPVDPAAAAGAGDDPAANPLAQVLEFLKDKLTPEDMAELEAMLDSSDAAPAAVASKDANPDPQNPDQPSMTADPTATPPGPPVTPGAPAIPATATPKEPEMDKKAMDSAIAQAKASGITETMQRMRAVAEAERVVRPLIGDVAIACDSAEDVYKQALIAKGIDVTNVHPSAFKTMVGMLPSDDVATATPKAVMAADAASVSGFKSRYPNAGNVRQL